MSSAEFLARAGDPSPQAEHICPRTHCNSAIDGKGGTHRPALKQQGAASAARQRMGAASETPGCPAHPSSPISQGEPLPSPPSPSWTWMMAPAWHPPEECIWSADVDTAVWTAGSVSVGTPALCNQGKSAGGPRGCGRGRRQQQAGLIALVVVSALPKCKPDGWRFRQGKDAQPSDQRVHMKTKCKARLPLVNIWQS